MARLQRYHPGQLIIKENEVEADTDDLSWCKYDTNMTSSENRSESLFL